MERRISNASGLWLISLLISAITEHRMGVRGRICIEHGRSVHFDGAAHFKCFRVIADIVVNISYNLTSYGRERSNLYRVWPVGGLWGRLYLSNVPGNGVTRIRWQEDAHHVPFRGQALRRRISRFSRSCGLLDHSFCQWATGKAVKARMSGAASASSSATSGKGSRSCSTTRSS